MPTDLSIAWARTEKAEAGWHADFSIMLVSLIACLAILALIALSPTFAAVVAAVGQY